LCLFCEVWIVVQLLLFCLRWIRYMLQFIYKSFTICELLKLSWSVIVKSKEKKMGQGILNNRMRTIQMKEYMLECCPCMSCKINIICYFYSLYMW
jgi:hypothetical protein